jgi:lysophospholipid acyltransferase (LPLAT)-like uncharacterized protein
MRKMSAGKELRWKTMGVLGRAILRFWAGSSRVRVFDEENYTRAKNSGKPIILLVWHGRLFLVPYFFRRRGIIAFVSPSEDGEIIARIGLGWGFKIIRGSSSHSIVRAWVEMKSELSKGGELIIVPDGPRGPARKLKLGCLKLARETGALLVPFSFSASRKRFLKSWDRFLFFFPFSRIAAVYGRPLTADNSADEAGLEKDRLRVEEALTALDAQADGYFEKSGRFVV